MSARSSFFEKGLLLTKPFQASKSWHQLSVYENKILVQNCLNNKWTLVLEKSGSSIVDLTHPNLHIQTDGGYWIMILIGSNVQIELCNFHLANWIWLQCTLRQSIGFDWIGLMSDASLWETISEGEKWMLSVMLLGALWGSSPRPSDFIMAKIFILPQYGHGCLNKKSITASKVILYIGLMKIVWNLIHLARNRISKKTLLKARQIRNDFFKSTFLPKNERTNSTLLLVNMFSFIIWKKVKTPKRHFEINWPLVTHCVF